jgi:ribosomal protein S18 acetylase RimI-like enzyme
MMEEINILNVSPDDPELGKLIEKLDRYLNSLYPADEIFPVDFDDPEVDSTFFVIAYRNDKPIGCGAIRPLSETEVELKRFYVEPQFRRKGIAFQMLTFLENRARESNFKAIRLETGDKQQEAINFYKKHGYYEIEKFGEYVDCPSSICFEKSLE